MAVAKGSVSGMYQVVFMSVGEYWLLTDGGCVGDDVQWAMAVTTFSKLVIILILMALLVWGCDVMMNSFNWFRMVMTVAIMMLLPGAH